MTYALLFTIAIITLLIFSMFSHKTKEYQWYKMPTLTIFYKSSLTYFGNFLYFFQCNTGLHGGKAPNDRMYKAQLLNR